MRIKSIRKSIPLLELDEVRFAVRNRSIIDRTYSTSFRDFVSRSRNKQYSRPIECDKTYARSFYKAISTWQWNKDDLFIDYNYALLSEDPMWAPVHLPFYFGLLR
jgi:hypothetical protein